MFGTLGWLWYLGQVQFSFSFIITMQYLVRGIKILRCIASKIYKENLYHNELRVPLVLVMVGFDSFIAKSQFN
jgi:hypothetical protein